MILRNSHCLPAICPGQRLESKDVVFPLITECSFTGEIHTRALASTFDDGESGPLAALYFSSYAQASFWETSLCKDL